MLKRNLYPFLQDKTISLISHSRVIKFKSSELCYVQTCIQNIFSRTLYGVVSNMLDCNIVVILNSNHAITFTSRLIPSGKV